MAKEHARRHYHCQSVVSGRRRHYTPLRHMLIVLFAVTHIISIRCGYFGIEEGIRRYATTLLREDVTLKCQCHG